jgi:sRNA-binding carbon storage regulator CsrA
MGFRPGCGYLKLFRYPRQSFHLEIPGQDDVIITIEGIDDRGQVTLGVDAPRSIRILRSELLRRNTPSMENPNGQDRDRYNEDLDGPDGVDFAPDYDR